MKSGVLLAFFMLIIYPLFLDPITTTFNITANTERLSITTLDENGSRLNLYDVDVYDTKPRPMFVKFSGYFKLNKGTSVVVERVAFGPAVLTFTASKSQTVGTLFNEKNAFVKHLGHYLQIFVSDLKAKADNGQTTILPIDGEVSLGRSIDYEVFEESTAILRSGQINLTGTSNLSESFDAGTTQLYLGDQIIFDQQKNKAFGFITLNEDPGMQAAYRVIAKQATILKPGPKAEGSSGYTISATKLDRLLKASTFQSISLFFGVVVIIITIITFSLDIYSNKKLLLTLLK